MSTSFFQNILTPNQYLYWFPPKEDKSEEVQLNIHFNNCNSFQINKNVSRYNLIQLFESIHDNHNTINNEIIDILSNYFVIENEKTLKSLIKSLKVFEQEEVVFLGKTELQIEHIKEDERWVTRFFKTKLASNFKIDTNTNNENQEVESYDSNNSNDFDNSDNNSDVGSDTDNIEDNLIEIANINYSNENYY
tara:strand:- start:187 stop:762 length:576 start_codon:yes stop_codon:yes gene_type:complete